jgi:hypothetical protein
MKWNEWLRKRVDGLWDEYKQVSRSSLLAMTARAPATSSLRILKCVHRVKSSTSTFSTGVSNIDIVNAALLSAVTIQFYLIF